MTSQQQLVCDNSTLANFKQWASAISAFFTTAGWTQSADTGQVNWSTIASVPGSGAYVYEVWKPGDALTVFYLKVEYGNVSGTNCPSLRVTLGTLTNGSGTLAGYVTDAIKVNVNSFTAPSATTQYECDFSGDASRIGVMMWRNGINNCQQLFAVERSLNASGTYTSSYVTIWTKGYSSNSTAAQYTIVFGAGVAPALKNSVFGAGGWTARTGQVINTAVNAGAFNGSIPFDTPAPYIGYFDYSCTVVGIGAPADFAEGVTFTASLYGSTRTFMPSALGAFGIPASGNTLMRYD